MPTPDTNKPSDPDISGPTDESEVDLGSMTIPNAELYQLCSVLDNDPSSARTMRVVWLDGDGPERIWSGTSGAICWDVKGGDGIFDLRSAVWFTEHAIGEMFNLGRSESDGTHVDATYRHPSHRYSITATNSYRSVTFEQSATDSTYFRDDEYNWSAFASVPVRDLVHVLEAIQHLEDVHRGCRMSVRIEEESLSLTPVANGWTTAAVGYRLSSEFSGGTGERVVDLFGFRNFLQAMDSSVDAFVDIGIHPAPGGPVNFATQRWNVNAPASSR